MSESKRGRLWVVIEIAVCTVLVAAISLNAVSKMDYLGPDTAFHIRMTDASRTALVAKNIVDGNGYSTYDLPAALIDFYDERGKLHEDHWVNADRFPFAAYATAALYTVTGSTSWEVGILAYNLLAFVGFLVLLYLLTCAVWGDRYAGVCAVTLALLHSYTYQFLYWKDGDMLLLTTACMYALYRYFQPGRMSVKLALGLGTCFAFVFLARPNLGAPLLLAFVAIGLRRLWRARKAGRLRRAFLDMLPREGLVLGVVFVWCLPFIIHSLREWGQPLFSANSLYQLPLGTRFGMGTDTWWKYTEPGHAVTLGRLFGEARGQLFGKFTSSWIATIKNLIGSYPIELALAAGLVLALRRRGTEIAQAKPVGHVAAFIGFALLANLAMLPLYGYQDLSYRHYVGFALPLLWLAAGRGLVMFGERAWPATRQVFDHVRAHAGLYGLALVVALIAWNAGASVSDSNRLFARTSHFVTQHWLVGLIACVLVFTHRWALRPPWCPRIVVVAVALVLIYYRPNADMKRANFVWAPATQRVWDVLRERHGLVSSFALQGEVAWNTERKNIPAPEWPMHIYSFLFDHKLEVEDLYIESADGLISMVDGPFSQAAPGFEGYARLQHYRTLPGYELVFHEGATRSYPKYRVKPHDKASTVFRLADRAAVLAMAHSPDQIELGDPRNVIYTAHGWGGYFELDGKRVVAATDVTRQRYTGGAEGPWEDTSATFFLDQRRPTALDLDFYAPHATTLQFYWNLDLYAYDPAASRKHHAIGSFTITAPGWQHVHFAIPPDLPRNGLNKLGFRVGSFQLVTACPTSLSDDTCRNASPPPLHKPDEEAPSNDVPVIVRPTGITDISFDRTSVFVGTLALHY